MPDVIERADVGVIQAGNDARLPLQAQAAFGIGRVVFRQHLDRDGAGKAGIDSAVDLAHAPFPDQGSDLVRSKAATWLHRPMACGASVSPAPRRRSNAARRRWRPLERGSQCVHRLDLERLGRLNAERSARRCGARQHADRRHDDGRDHGRDGFQPARQVGISVEAGFSRPSGKPRGSPRAAVGSGASTLLFGQPTQHPELITRTSGTEGEAASVGMHPDFVETWKCERERGRARAVSRDAP